MRSRFSCRSSRRSVLALALVLPLCGIAATTTAAWAQNPAVTVSVDANANRRAIDPRVYGVAYASQAQLSDLNVTLNRNGGNNTSRYNWQLNADNRGNDWFFQSIGEASSLPGDRLDQFVTTTRAAGAEPMITLPMVGWVAKLGPNRSKLASFSIAKYGAQTGNDWQWFPDAGNGISAATGQNITGNDPNDANIPADATFQQGLVQHLIGKFGQAATGGVKYYLYDNEHSIWHSTHRDVHPVGATMDEIKQKIVDYGTKVRAVEPNAVLVGPEEWGWSGYFYSGYDQQYGAAHGWTFPDRAAHGGMDYLPWLLSQLRQHQTQTGTRLLDVFSVHFYPQGGEFWGDTSTDLQLRRNRSTRALWDPNYVDETWIGTPVQLIPRLKNWVASYYPGLQTGITEYNWGAESHINGATTQADILGIFGREGLDLAARWATPDPATPTYKAIKLYRNYDGQKNGFGETSVAATSSANPDNLSTFASVRTSDGALTVMAVSKVLSGETPVRLNLANFSASGPVQVWQLTSANTITRAADLSVSNNAVSATLPAQSVTLFVIPKGTATPPPAADPTFTTTAMVSPVSPARNAAATISVTVRNASGTMAKGIVDLEIYNASGAKVFQQYLSSKSFTTGQARYYLWQWTPTAAGTYTVKLGVFSSDWSKQYHWNNGAATVTVK